MSKFRKIKRAVDEESRKALYRYNALYNNEVYVKASKQLGPELAIAMSVTAVALCGDPNSAVDHTVMVIAETNTAVQDFLALFI